MDMRFEHQLGVIELTSARGAAGGEVERWSLTTLREKLARSAPGSVRHGRHVVFQLAEVAVLHALSAEVLHPRGTVAPSRRGA